MTISPSSLDEQVIFGKDSALANSAANASPDNANSLIVSLPCGGTNFDIVQSYLGLKIENYTYCVFLQVLDIEIFLYIPKDI